jgi:hypothetical protein
VEDSNGPPKATLARRAKSYSDFYEVVRAQLKKDAKQDKSFLYEGKEAKTETQCALFYNDVEDELLDSSQEEFQYEMQVSSDAFSCLHSTGYIMTSCYFLNHT